MTTLADLASPVTATMLVLGASALVDEAAGGTARVHGGQVPHDRVSSMPERCCVVTPAGAPAIRPGSGDNVPVSVHRVDVRCYGRTPYEAEILQLAATQALKQWGYGQTSGRHLVHWFNKVGGPVAFRDPEGDWPVSVVTFQLQMADELAPA